MTPVTPGRILAGALAAGLWVAGTLPSEAQTPPVTTPAPPAQVDEGGVEWGPSVDVDAVPRLRPKPQVLRQPAPDRKPRPKPERRKPDRVPRPKAELEPEPDAFDPADCDRDPSERATIVPEEDADRLRLREEAERELARRCQEIERREARRRAARPQPGRRADGTPTPAAPGFVDALPGPSTASGVPNFVIRKFRVPVFLLPIYQAAGIQYGVRWEVLAAINEIETDYGRNLNVSSAGALGWMQFIPSSWRAYGVDANKDGKKDPYNPVDAIFAAARYLKAAGYEKDVRRSIFAYNHADWYVDSVMLRAKLISGVPADLVGSLTGLTEGRFPVAARARYADDAPDADRERKRIEVFARNGSPVVATGDGEIKKVTRHSVTLQDVYGNRYTYSGLSSTAKYHPVPKQDAADPRRSARATKANPDPRPKGSASAGRQPTRVKRRLPAPRPAASVPVKERLFAHPDMPAAREAGGIDQLLDAKTRKGFETYANYFSRPFGADAKDVRLRRLKVGSRVIGGTILGRVGRPDRGKASHMTFAIRPAGKGAPVIDPKPILDGWKLLEATAVYRASGRNVLYGDDGTDGLSIGQILLLSKPQLERRVLSDDRIRFYPGGEQDIRTGQIDRRVLATLAYLAESGLEPTVSSLKGNHGLLTASGNVSEHSSGNAVDISKINDVPILGHQDAGGITEQAVRRLMRLQGTTTPHQIISLLDLGANTVAMGDHADHIHVGFKPLFGDNRRLGRQAMAVLRPGQWSDLLEQLRRIDNPVVPTSPSKYALPVRPRKGD